MTEKKQSQYYTQEQGLFGPIENSISSTTTVPAGSISLVQVAFDKGGDNVYDYGTPDLMQGQIQPGQRVKVPFGRSNRLETAFCIGFPDTTNVKKVKMVIEIVDERPLLDENMIKLGQWISKYYCYSLGAVLAAMVPAAVKHKIGMVKQTYIRLTPKAINSSQDEMAALRLSPKGKAILDFLRHQMASDIDSVLLEEAAGKNNCQKGPFKTLEKLELLEIWQQKENARSSLESTSENQISPGFELNQWQQQAFDKINELIGREEFNAVLLHGVTGSGKTEVYMKCIEQVLAKGCQALVLVPEIALTPQTESRFLSRFKNVAVLHSAMNNTERHHQWQRVANGAAEVVVGARSAIFAPMPNLGIIVVDEEHEPSYKQESTPRYHGRDVAIMRAHLMKIPVILGSATPSLETLLNSKTRTNYHQVRIDKRVLDLPMPKVHVVNMREEMTRRKGRHLISQRLENTLRNCVKAGKQAILLLNRRGHSSFLYCNSCDFAVTCPNCDVSLTYHKRRQNLTNEVKGMLMCHHCLHLSRVPQVCPLCQKKLSQVGPGTQKAEEELQHKLPEVHFKRVDSDSMRPENYQEVLGQFESGEIDVLMGTQMIGKGLDYPNVAMVGVINADTALGIPDFRSAERTFQLIAQVAGRCGRATDTGIVIVQSYMPEEPAIELACQHDYNSFAQGELMIREKCAMPPYHRLARIILRDTNLEKLQEAGKTLRDQIDQVNSHYNLAIQVRGPMPAGIARLENYHRYEILLKAPTPLPIQQLLAVLRQHTLTTLKVQAVVDVDPMSLM